MICSKRSRWSMHYSIACSTTVSPFASTVPRCEVHNPREIRQTACIAILRPPGRPPPMSNNPRAPNHPVLADRLTPLATVWRQSSTGSPRKDRSLVLCSAAPAALADCPVHRELRTSRCTGRPRGGSHHAHGRQDNRLRQWPSASLDRRCARRGPMHMAGTEKPCCGRTKKPSYKVHPPGSSWSPSPAHPEDRFT